MDEVELGKKIADKLSDEEQDAIYRYVWAGHVREDIESYIEGSIYEVSLDEDDIAIIAERYVYDGEYDCTLNYWDNLDNLISDYILLEKNGEDKS